MLPGHSATPFSPVLHLLRGLAALWVMAFHCWYFAGAPALVVGGFFQMGGYGVHLFYVLSAFLLGQQYFQYGLRGGYIRFLRRRFLRIFPAYYLQLGVLALLAAGTGFYVLPSIEHLLAHLVMWFHWPPMSVQPINGVWWTLPVEFSFYLVLPLLAAAMLRFGWAWVLAATLIITVSYRAWVFETMAGQSIAMMANLIGQLPGVFSVFGMGLTAACLAARRRQDSLPNWQSRVILAVATTVLIGWMGLLVLLADSYWQRGPLLYLWESVNGGLLATVVFALHSLNPQLTLTRFWEWLGDISYGVYLWHLPVLLAVTRLIPDAWPGTFQLAALMATVPLVCGLGHLSFVLIERPVMGLGRQR